MLYKLNNIEYVIRNICERDIEKLLFIKNDRDLHIDRLERLRCGRAAYLAAFINDCPIGFVEVSFGNKFDVLKFTDNNFCAEMMDLNIIEPLRNLGIGSRLVYEAEKICMEKNITYLGLDVNPKDNPRAKKLYESLGYVAVGDLHLDGIYHFTDNNGIIGESEDWCIDMIKKLK
ncbi:MAG: GNAT family N-acetyltransferase [Lachnospiraceae bacterium]